MTDIYNKFRETVETRKMIFQDDRILLSLSAGKDSMAMLDLMLRYKEIVHFELGIFHLNHLTRGIDSDNDEALVKKKSAEYKIPVYTREFDFKSGKIPGISFEEHARNVRYDMLNEIMLSDNFNKTATAHNSKDNVETLLMRIFNGTGIYGLKGISYINKNIIRPLLDIYPDEIYSYLEERGIPWREDNSNSDNNYHRNYIRNIIIPSITKTFPDAEENINRLSKHAEENEYLLSFFAEKLSPGWLIETDSGHFISTEKFSDNIPFIKYMISRALYSHYGIRLNSGQFDEITRRIKSEKSNLTLYEKGDILISKSLHNNKNGIIISDKNRIKHVADRWEYELKIENINSVFITELDRYLNYRRSSYTEFISLKKDSRYIFIKLPVATTAIQLRNRRAGDRIALQNGLKKIKELMIEKKLDINTKKRVPLIVIDGQIAAFLPGVVRSYPDRVSCNFWVDHCTENMFVFYFTEVPDFNIIK